MSNCYALSQVKVGGFAHCILGIVQWLSARS